MADRLLIDLTDGGRVSVGIQLDDGPPCDPLGKAAGFASPLDAAALEELRWYLEDYLRLPFGAYESRGPETAARLVPWGEELFGAVFRTGSAQAAYQRVRDNLTGTRVVIRSGSAGLLGLPWELMRDPSREVPLALDVAGMDRSLPTAGSGAAFETVGGRSGC